MKKLKIWLKIDIFGELALLHVNLEQIPEDDS